MHHVRKSIPGFQSCNCRIPVHVSTISCSYITCEKRYRVFRVAVVEYQYTYLLYYARTSRAKIDTRFSELQLSNTSTRIYYIMFVHHVQKSIPGFQSCSCRIPVHVSTILCSYITCENRYQVFRVAVVEYQYTYLLYYVRTTRAKIDTRFSELQLSNTSTRIYYIMFVHQVRKSIPGLQSCSCRIPVHVYTISCSFVHHVQKSIRGFLSCSCRIPEHVSIISCSYVHHVRKSIPGLQSCSCRIPVFTKNDINTKTSTYIEKLIVFCFLFLIFLLIFFACFICYI